MAIPTIGRKGEALYRDPAFSAYIDPMTDSPHADPPRPVVLCILGGWGERAEHANDAVALGKTPN